MREKHGGDLLSNAHTHIFPTSRFFHTKQLNPHHHLFFLPPSSSSHVPPPSPHLLISPTIEQALFCVEDIPRTLAQLVCLSSFSQAGGSARETSPTPPLRLECRQVSEGKNPTGCYCCTGKEQPGSKGDSCKLLRGIVGTFLVDNFWLLQSCTQQFRVKRRNKIPSLQKQNDFFSRLLAFFLRVTNVEQ